MIKIRTVKDFYNTIEHIKKIRSKIVKLYFFNDHIGSSLVHTLEDIAESLNKIKKNDSINLIYNKSDEIAINIAKETGDLEKDIFFLTRTESDFYNHLKSFNPSYEEELKKCAYLFTLVDFKTFVTSRSAVVDNNRSRFIACVQPVYNSIYLMRFVLNNTEHPLIISSAPLDWLLEVSVNLPNLINYAGSNGREYMDKNGQMGIYPLEKKKQKLLIDLNKKINSLIKKPEYEIFQYIGKGIQYKFGETQITRQDRESTISKEKSDDLFLVIEYLLNSIDPKKEFFSLSDNGRVISIKLKEADKEGSKIDGEVEKSHNMQFLNNELALEMASGRVLVCGTSLHDYKMYREVRKINPDTFGVIIGNKTMLTGEAEKDDHLFLLSNPDIYVMMLNKLALQHHAL